MFALAIASFLSLVPEVLGELFPSFIGPYPDSQYSVLGNTITVLAFVSVPIALAFAMLRYHLFDIDIIINRTLVYGSLTAILAGMYFAIVLGSQAVLRLLTGKEGDQPVIVVLTTLLVAALVQPLRRHIQRVIDRRFYRARYDAAKTVAAFGASMRHQVELQALSQQLLATVEDTMRPSHLSLWLNAKQPGGGQ